MRRSAVLACALAGMLRAEAQLARTSPFLPPQSSTTAPTAGAPLEFRGTIRTADGTLFRVHDPARKAGVWVKLNERENTLDVLVKQHDPNQNTLTVEHQGKTLTLAVRESKIVSSGSAAHPMPAPPQMAQPVVGPAVTQSVVVNPTPADEQRRLEAVAAEVARRRALREQATQQLNQGGAQVPQPQPAVQQRGQPQQQQVPQNYPPRAPQPAQGRPQR
ncbi:MAG: hypothetical protein Q7S40_01000 [Opitutaceae bacterium]|nr:hypothetical protein [Opitutaceae bacterium]